VADLGEVLLDNGSVDQAWNEHVDAALLVARGPDRDAAAHDIDEWTARG
jgi:DNA processing protein